jgi:alkanesulfonate monooxygenase SsuD/methylene tetrahydromethanopterin reductase-like flavin-dependent oxidoreductase (luciferase family)
MGRVQFGLIVPEGVIDASRRHLFMQDVDRLLTLAQGHYDSAWFIDHLGGPSIEGWTALTYLSALHPEFMWGHSVLCQSFRNPALLAKMSATLHWMSGGRFVLGIGAGGQEEEYLAYGYPFPSGGTRVAQLDEALQIIKAMWTAERTTFEGTYYRVTDARCEPKPNTLPPIMVGAFGPKMLRLTARHADWWNVSSTGIAAYRDLVQAFERACDAERRDPATVRRTWGGGCVCAPTEREATQLAATRVAALGPDFAYQPGEDIGGTAGQVIEQLLQFIELGVDYFLLDCGGFPELTTVEMLVHEVMPAINGN